MCFTFIAYVHTHTHAHTHTHTHTHSYKFKRAHTHTLTGIHTLALINVLESADSLTQTHKHSPTHRNIHTKRLSSTQMAKTCTLSSSKGDPFSSVTFVHILHLNRETHSTHISESIDLGCCGTVWSFAFHLYCKYMSHCVCVCDTLHVDVCQRASVCVCVCVWVCV